MTDSDTAWDHWVRDALAESYGPVAEERLPDDWLRLLEPVETE